MTNTKQRGGIESENEVWQAIAAFESILEVMPDDRASLETLSHAYEHAGDRAKALDYLLRLAEVILAEKDSETAGLLLERLREYSEAGEEVQLQMSRLQELAMAEAQQVAHEEPMHRPHAQAENDLSAFRVTDELAFAWKLFEAGEISQVEYSAVAHDLAELSVDTHLATISVLHVLATRAFSGLERVMGYASRDARTPLVSLEAYEVGPEAALLLPLEFMIRRGAVVFGSMGGELLVAVMNPYDQHLREDVAKQTACICHFFLTLPGEFDALVSSLHSAA